MGKRERKGEKLRERASGKGNEREEQGRWGGRRRKGKKSEGREGRGNRTEMGKEEVEGEGRQGRGKSSGETSLEIKRWQRKRKR